MTDDEKKEVQKMIDAAIAELRAQMRQEIVNAKRALQDDIKKAGGLH
jgi:hypothetical protein